MTLLYVITYVKNWETKVPAVMKMQIVYVEQRQDNTVVFVVWVTTALV